MEYRVAMKISETIHYDASPDAVFAMLTDAAFQERKCLDAGAVSHDTVITPEGSGARIVTHRELPTHDLPDFAKSIVGSKLAVTETYAWGPAAADTSRVGDLTVQVSGAPVVMRAKVALVPNGGGTRMQIDGDLKASIPLLGGKVEKASAPAVVDAIHSEGRTGRGWLAEHA